MRPILLALVSVNQRAPSGPVVMSWGRLGDVMMGKSVMTPAVVMRPILSGARPIDDSENQSAPSGPATIPQGAVFGLTGNWLNAPAVVSLPMDTKPPSVNQSAP